MKRLALAAVLAAAACGGNSSNGGQDATPPPGGSDANPGGSDGGVTPPPAQTLTAYVIDLVMNHTTATDLPRPFTEFATLTDPDGSANNLTAYQSLF